jgi:hypothetical protein
MLGIDKVVFDRAISAISTMCSKSFHWSAVSYRGFEPQGTYNVQVLVFTLEKTNNDELKSKGISW